MILRPDPKPSKPILLEGAAYTKFKHDLWENRAHRHCESCGKYVPLTVGGAFDVFSCAHVSHIKPRKKGGDIPSNVKILCYNCHFGPEGHGPRWSHGKEMNDG